MLTEAHEETVVKVSQLVSIFEDEIKKQNCNYEFINSVRIALRDSRNTPSPDELSDSGESIGCIRDASSLQSLPSIGQVEQQKTRQKFSRLKSKWSEIMYKNVPSLYKDEKKRSGSLDSTINFKDLSKKYTRRYTAQPKHCSAPGDGSEEDESFEFIHQDNKTRERTESTIHQDNKTRERTETIRLQDMGAPLADEIKPVNGIKAPHSFISSKQIKVPSGDPVKGPPPLVLEYRSPSITQLDFTALSYSKKSVGDCTQSEAVGISHTQRDIVASLDNAIVGDNDTERVVKLKGDNEDSSDNVSVALSQTSDQAIEVNYKADHIISPVESLSDTPKPKELEYVVTSPTIDPVSISVIGPAINVSDPVKDDAINGISEPETVFRRALERAAFVKDGDKVLTVAEKEQDISLETAELFNEVENSLVQAPITPCKEEVDVVAKESPRVLPLSVELALSALNKDQEHLEAAVQAVEEVVIVEVALFDAMEDVSSLESVSEKVDISTLPPLVRSRRSLTSRDDVTKPATLPKPKRISVGEVCNFTPNKPLSLPAVQGQLEVVQEQLISSVDSLSEGDEDGESSDDFFAKFELFVQQSGVTADASLIEEDRLSHLKSLQEKLKLKNIASCVAESESSEEEDGGVRDFVAGCFTITSTLHSTFNNVSEEDLISCFLLSSPNDYCTDYNLDLQYTGGPQDEGVEYAGSEGSEGEISQLCLDLYEDT